MGYILPINHYGYKDYHVRTMKKKQDPIYIEKTYKVTPIKFDQFVKDQLEKESFTFRGHKRVVIDKCIQDSNNATFEGKGALFNNRV